MRCRKRISYQTICAMKEGDEDALQEIVKYYEPYINAVCRRDLYDQFGNCREAVDLQLKDEIIAEYVFAILYTYDHRRMPGEKPRKLQ